MRIFTPEARQHLARALRLTLDDESGFLDPQGRSLQDWDVWSVIFKAAYECETACRMLEAMAMPLGGASSGDRLQSEEVITENVLRVVSTLQSRGTSLLHAIQARDAR